MGEVVCSVCMSPSDAQNRPESEFWRAFHRSSILFAIHRPVLAKKSRRELGNGRCVWHLPGHPVIAHPRPQLRSRADTGFARVSPTIVIPFPRVDRQMELRNGVLAQYLAER